MGSKKNPAKGMGIKQKIDFYFEDIETPIGRLVDFIIIALILLSAVIFVVETYDVSPAFRLFLDYFDSAILVIFIIEYCLRFWVAEKKLKHFFNIYSLIDLIAILPFFFMFTRLQFIRIFRVLRLLRFTRFLKKRHFFFGSITEDVLLISRIIFTILAIIFVSSGLIYHVEHTANPEKFQTFFDAVYFSIVTLTTVGFGDITPISQNGRIITIFMIVSGIIFIPWQLANAIRRIFLTTHKVKTICKGCGLEYHDRDATHCKACGRRIYQEYEGI